MKYDRLKNEEIEKLAFVKNAVIVGTELRSFEVVIDGENYYLEGSEYSPVKVSRKAPDVIEDRWTISGTVAGHTIIPVVFDNEYDADSNLKAADCETLVKSAVKFNVTKNCVVQ